VAASPAGGDFQWRVAEGQLPDGISLDGATGLLSGSATRAGDYKFTVEVADKNGDTFQQPLTLTVRKLVLTTSMVPDAVPGQPYSYKLQAVGGQPPYTFTNLLPIPLPGMIQLSSSGEVTFDPGKSPGMLMFYVRDSAGAEERFALTIPMRGLTLTDSAFLPAATVGAPYSFTFHTIGANGDITWTVKQDLIGSGLSFNTKTGELSGTPTVADLGGIDVTARDKSTSVTRTFYLTVNGTGGTAPPAVAACGRCKR
jgi:hypothetical protein